MKSLLSVLVLSVFSSVSAHALQLEFECEAKNQNILKKGAVASVTSGSADKNIVNVAVGTEVTPGVTRSEVLTYKLSRVTLENGKLKASGVEQSGMMRTGKHGAIDLELEKFAAFHYTDRNVRMDAKVTIYPPSALVVEVPGQTTEVTCSIVVP